MEILTDIDIRDFKAWEGGADTLKTVIENDKCEELEQYLTDLFCDSTPTETQINDVLWFDSEEVLKAVGISTFEPDFEVGDFVLNISEMAVSNPDDSIFIYTVSKVDDDDEELPYQIVRPLNKDNPLINADVELDYAQECELISAQAFLSEYDTTENDEHISTKYGLTTEQLTALIEHIRKALDLAEQGDNDGAFEATRYE